MAKKVCGKGRLRHRFWGQYSAVIGLLFDTESDAELARKALGDDWKRVEGRGLVWSGDSDALDRVCDTLEEHGADRSAIASVLHSIDYGDPFQVAIAVDK